MTTDFNAATWTTADLLLEVYRACAMPSTGTVDWTPAAVLREATSIIWSFAGPTLSSAREGRLATSILRAVPTDALSASAQDYELPPMALGDAIDGVDWRPSTGGVPRDLDVLPLGLENVYSSPNIVGEPQYFALLDGTVRVYPKPGSASGALSITYQRRHGDLVNGTDTTTVSSVVDNAGFAKVTLAATPSSFVVGAWLDFMGLYYPYRTKLHGAKIAIAHGSNQFTLSTTTADFTAANLVGDTAVIYGKTPYVQLPAEMRSALVSKIAAKISGIIGDASMYGRHRMDAADEMKAAKEAISPRTKATQQKAFNPHSIARSALPRGIPRWSREDG